MVEPGFDKANAFNLPRVDVLMSGEFLGSSNELFLEEFRNVKTSASSRPGYGDGAVSYVQVKREGYMCIVKGKICPEQKVHAKIYGVTLKVDEMLGAITSVECYDCMALGICIHAIAFLMWAHRRSEELPSTLIDSYWDKPKPSIVGATMKYITAKQLSNGPPRLPSNNTVLKKFLAEATKRKLKNCALLKYQPGN